MPLAVAAALALSTLLAQADAPLPPPPDGTALAPAPPPPPPPPAEPSAGHAAAPSEEPPPRFGLALEAGFPQGATLGLLYRPLDLVKVWAGPAWDYGAVGVNAGVALMPFRWAVNPTLSVEGGRYFSSNMSWIAASGAGVPEGIRPLLDDVRYSYVATHLGFEIGSPRGFAFTFRAGLAWVDVLAKGTATTTSTSGGGSGTTTVQFDDPRFRGTAPSVKLGLQYWF